MSTKMVDACKKGTLIAMYIFTQYSNSWACVLQHAMESDSPVHTGLLKYTRRRILSSDEETYGRAEETSTRFDSAPCTPSHDCPTAQQGNTGAESHTPVEPIGSNSPGSGDKPSQRSRKEPLGSSSQGAAGNPSQARDDGRVGKPNTPHGEPATPTLEPGPEEMQVDSEDDPGIIIRMVPGDEQAWITEEESDDSSSSTPSYRQGNHHQGDSKVLQMIRDDAQRFMERPRQHRPPSIQILADSRIKQWPAGDKVCVVDFHPNWTLKKWVAGLQAEIVRIQCNIVVLYLERTEEILDVPPLKNMLHSICKVIRQHKAGARIFVSNMLPKVGGSPLRRSAETSFNLLQAIRSTNRALLKVHYLSTFEQFCSKGKIVKPTHQFFAQDGQLTQYGCLILRDCIMREVGIKSYWFS